jgi:phage major head subunit gpT-like protein
MNAHFDSDHDYYDSLNGSGKSKPVSSIVNKKSDNTMVASFEDYEKIRGNMKMIVIVANSPKEKAEQEYRIRKAKQKMEDEQWKFEQRYGFNPYEDTYSDD